MKRSRQQRLRELGRDALWLILPLAGLVLSIAMTLRLGLLEPDPPRQPENICEIFREHPVWYDYAAQSQERSGFRPSANNRIQGVRLISISESTARSRSTRNAITIRTRASCWVS